MVATRPLEGGRFCETGSGNRQRTDL